MGSKMGRPTDNPKTNDIKVRIDDDTYKRLIKYCAENGITKAAAVRQGINLVLQKK